jgi:hypothetical protein
MAAITQFGQKAFGFTTPGFLQSFMNPGLVSEQSLIAMGVNPAAYQSAKESFRASEIADMNAGYTGGFGSPAAQGQTSSQSGEGNPGEQPGQTSSDTGVGNPGEGAQGGNTSSDTGVGNPGEGAQGGNTSSDTGVGNPGESNYMGGLVTNVFGTDPTGPDEGQVNIMRGEYVIKKSAVKKYGQGLLDMINDGKIPAKKMKSLLG